MASFVKDKNHKKNKNLKKEKKHNNKKLWNLFDKNRKGLVDLKTSQLDKYDDLNPEENCRNREFNDSNPSARKTIVEQSSAFKEFSRYRHSRDSSDEFSTGSDQLLSSLSSDCGIKSTQSNNALSHAKSMSSLATSPIIKKGKLFSRNKPLQSVSEIEQTSRNVSCSVSTNDINDLDKLCDTFGRLNMSAEKENKVIHNKQQNGGILKVSLPENSEKGAEVFFEDKHGARFMHNADPLCSYTESGNLVTTPAAQRKLAHIQQTNGNGEVLEETEPVKYGIPATSYEAPSFQQTTSTNPCSFISSANSLNFMPSGLRSESLSNISKLPGPMVNVPYRSTASLENMQINGNGYQKGALALTRRTGAAVPSDILDMREKLRNTTVPQDLNLIDSTEAFYKRLHHKSYPMVHKHRGRAFVATYTAGRPGWDNDLIRLEQLFLFLKIETEYHFDETKKNLLDHLDIFAKSGENASVDCIFVVLMGHGGRMNNKDFLESADLHHIYLRENLDQIFNNESCRSLKGKPKMFVLQMCRDARSTASSLFGADCLIDTAYTFTDYIFAFATQPGRIAMRNHQNGSWFIQDFVDVFLERSHDSSVLDMLTQVMKRCGVKGQTSEPAMNLTQDFYLFPGIWTRKFKRKWKQMFSKLNILK